ncbi:MAG: Lrp/AsnC ligand binding domain-containing protein [Nitrosotalea sp.]
MNLQHYGNVSKQSGPAMVYILINCEHGKETIIMEKLHSIKDVKEIQQISGNYDVLMKLESMMTDTLIEIINQEIRKMEGIHSTTTLICSKVSNEKPIKVE